MTTYKKKVAKFKKLSLLKKILIIMPLIIVAAFLYFFIFKDLPSPTRLDTANTPQSSQIFDRNGKLLYTIYEGKNRTFVSLNEIPKYAQEATIAIEDKDFYKHGAIDIRGIIRAAFSTIFKKKVQGGSTLTQQLVKNSLLTQERTIPRKIKEIILAYATEFLYSKNQILDMYLNQSPYGGDAYGIETASQKYFGKPAKDLDLAESALLAGLPQSPTEYSPSGSHPEFAKERQLEVLSTMETQGYITGAQEKKAAAEKLKYKAVSNDIEAPHFVLYIKDLLIKKYGEQKVEEGGLKVKTTLDLNIQNMAQASVSAEIAQLKGYHVTNGAALVTDPATGEILGMVGSKDYFDTTIDGNVNVTLAHRQPGSSIKPINYAIGLASGYTAATPFIDQKVCFPQGLGLPDYCPVNYDGKFHGIVQMRYALGNSINIPAVKMLKLNGVTTMIATASAMGITTWTDPSRYGLSLTLGGGEVTMLDMATAYGVFANQGYRIDLQPILEVRDSKNKVIEKYNPPASPVLGKKVMSQAVTYIISDILADNSARALEFGTNSQLKIGNLPISVKTGTTNDFKDNWTIGYTKDFLTAVWVGNNDNSPMNGLASGITGAAPIWNDIMSQLLIGKKVEKPIEPSNVINLIVCSTSGLIPPADNSCPTRSELFIRGMEPKAVDPGKQNVWIDKTTNDLPKDPKQTDNLELRSQYIVTDPTGDRYCVDCPHPTPTPSPTPTP